MSVGMIYPNPKNIKLRITVILFVLLSTAPLCFMILVDIYNSFWRRDIFNIIRHSTIVGPFFGGLFKMFIMLYKTETAKALMDEIDKDYQKFCKLPKHYTKIIDIRIADNIFYSEKCWVLTVVTCTMVFPGTAVVSTMYNCLFSDCHKVMIHHVEIPYTEPETSYQSPVYELMFIYMLYVCALFIITFVGLDGFFGLCVNHACLKMELYCKAVEEALGGDDEVLMRNALVEVIREQNRTARYTELIQETFNIWLGIILLATMIQIGTCMFKLIEGGDMDFKYIVFTIGIIIHIYLPCSYSAKLKDMSTSTATLIYCAGWESVPSKTIRRMTQFMIARAQIPTEITAINILIFDMSLFVRIMNSSYSMYTLLRS
ncbi:odorant receptor 85f-like [Danaus plexippus]|nr:odorant receptor 85f-like [Danaus plexippus]